MELKKNYIDVETLKKSQCAIKKIFFYRICGTGMGAAACLLKEAGYHIEGGDTNFYPPMSTYLKSTNILLHDLDSFNLENLKEFDLIVIGNVVPKNGQEAKKLEQIGTLFCSFPAAIGALVLCRQNVVGIAGTHGKTTTTYLLTQIFEKLGKKPGYLIGGVLPERNSSRIGDGSYFFIEADEYDCAYFEKISKFRQYYINHLILTSLEFDHADIFASLEDIVKEFSHLMPTINKSLIGCSDYPEIEKLSKLEQVNLSSVNFYGESSKMVPEIISMTSRGSEFKIRYKAVDYNFKTNLLGVHNILNLTACLIFAFNEGVTYQELQHSISELKLVKRRQEERGLYKESLIIDDFAHHPKAVHYTIAGLKLKFPDKKLVVFMEPNSATARSSLFQDEFVAALKLADKTVLIQPAKSTSIDRLGNIDCSFMSSQLNQSIAVNSLGKLREQIEQNTDRNNVLVFLSNGTCLGLWESDFADAIVS